MPEDNPFLYKSGKLACEDIDLTQLAVEHGTPCYVYSKNAIVSRFRAYKEALAGLPHLVCFSVKSNSNLSVLRTLASEGAGFDIVSGGELFRVLTAAGESNHVVFSGVGKTQAEIQFALEKGIHSFNCESEAELEMISKLALSADRLASVAIRINPDVDAVTHPYISTGLHEHKFGLNLSAAEALYARASEFPGVVLEGVSCHIGSQLLDFEPLLQAADRAIDLATRLREHGLPIRYLDLGGGLGVKYRTGDRPASIADFINHLRPKVEPLGLTLMLEPGRSIVAEAGVLLTRVVLVKKNGEKTFVIVDAAMNDLIRPSLYQAHHEIVPVHPCQGGDTATVDVVGPVCESGDFFARNREMPAVKAGDLLAIRTAGAYGFVLSSNYNSRPRACELLVDGQEVQVARRRETYADLLRGEIA